MDAIFDTFKLRAEAVSAEVHRFPHKTGALDFIVGYLQSAGRSRFAAILRRVGRLSFPECRRQDATHRPRFPA